MVEHTFGGDWTDDKLARLSKYLAAYQTIFTANENARYFTTWYVDAFAGTGSRSSTGNLPSDADTLFDVVYRDPETARYQDGSARIAVGLDHPFDQYLFVEKSSKRVLELKSSLARDYSNRIARCDFKHGDANVVLKEWCEKRDWGQERAVVFLDPYGMQVEWKTIESLARTKAIDLWYLFPLGAGVIRLLTQDGKIEESWQKRLDSVFGTADWRSQFYQKVKTRDLFGEYEELTRNATIENLQGFIQARLASCFAKVAKGLILRNSKSFPLYCLCFAAANERAAGTAIKIAQSILDH